MHIHLDPIGGIAGDMFVAAMLDACPNLQTPLLNMLASLPLGQPVNTCVEKAVDAGIAGKRFQVCLTEHNHHYHHDHHHGSDHHDHHHWWEIRSWLEQHLTEDTVKIRAISIFELLAAAEAKIHQQDIEQVCFHEVGAWDCIMDIVAASWLIVHSGATSWSVSALPWGGGTVKCAHGVIPVPAPATLALLSNFDFIDDGEHGERVTPTGAAILASLAPSRRVQAGKITAVGYGFGNRKLAHRANTLRVTCLNDSTPFQHETLTIIQCDIDDMSGEMLAIARENLRKLPGVLEITEHISQGKKQRFINTLTLLCLPAYSENILMMIFRQTTTLGVRYWNCQRLSLSRNKLQIEHHGEIFSVKTAHRPDGVLTSKLEADHLTGENLTQYQRMKYKSEIEQQAEVQNGSNNETY